MRASSDDDSASATSIWHSPTPYLFGSLGLLMAIMAVALISLACFYCRNHSGNSSSDHDGDDEEEEKPASLLTSMTVLYADPNFAVIMAGEDSPTYLATPL
ncbi:hypothetical protein OIU78_026310 [Salix suchowensis]|nr:protein GLUTAMINE DUMPER [Salix suchowensis]KAJ6290540.1 hypothetical protein OIU78_026310 [Salix suchowensis]